MKIINGHSVERYYSGGFWLVDGFIYCDSLYELAECVGLSVDELIEVLYG